VGFEFPVVARASSVHAVQTAVVRAVSPAGCLAGYPGQSCVFFDPVYNTTSFASFSVLAFEGDLGQAVYDVARADGPRGQPLGGKGAVPDNEAGCEAGKQPKGRKIHALVDSEGFAGAGRRFTPPRSRPRLGRAGPRPDTQAAFPGSN